MDSAANGLPRVRTATASSPDRLADDVNKILAEEYAGGAQLIDVQYSLIPSSETVVSGERTPADYVAWITLRGGQAS